ncbi:MAG: twin-arginine translocase subunit TatC [Candidatus Dormibacteria bacterium]
MTVLEHLEALRRVLLISIGAWLGGSVVGFVFRDRIFDFLVGPGKGLFPNGHLNVFRPTEPFNLSLKLAAFGGLILALPVILASLWSFISPGLYKREKRAALPLLLASLVLFAAGAALAYHLMPVALKFLVGFGGPNLVYLPDAADYIDFVSIFMVAFGATFQMPVVLVILGMAGVVSAGRLGKWRLYAVIAILVAAMLVTPGSDPFSPFLLAVPLLVLYEASIVVLRLMGR